MLDTVALFQGGYFFITGIWPIFSIHSFMAVTGPKTDLWLVKTVGLVLAVIGLALLIAGARSEVALPVVVLATGSAAALAAIDVVYAIKKVIAPVYLLDAVLEAALIAWWSVALFL
ncbi:hypothetical protein [Geomonas ferrireducens]|uniref:hypothetical protein n=1 Tax=Geomonas ferrireducens TaxID=2570227 RepID=UPI0010A7E582|nr:hypothetical protein [Geomonas ferrireducens]